MRMDIKKAIAIQEENVSVGKSELENAIEGISISHEDEKECKEWIAIQEMSILALEEKLEREKE